MSTGDLPGGDEENEPEVLAAAEILCSLRLGNRAIVDPCPWWSMVPRKKIRRISYEIEEAKKEESPPRRHVRISHPPMPAWMDTKIQAYRGTDVVLVLQKDLMKSDVDDGQSRFSIPRLQILNEFLTEEERETLDTKKGIAVMLIQPCRKTCNVELRKWELATSFSYVLVKTWNKVVKNSRNELRKDVTVQLWAFRIQGKLNFAMVRVNTRGETDRK